MLPVKDTVEYEALTKGAKVLEEDGYGIKVLRLPDDRILKLFRRKRLLSSQIWSPLATRFKQHAETLTAKGIPTITISEAFEVPHLERQGVLYQALPGETLREWLQANPGDPALKQLKAYGAFLAKVHALGILFRSIHLGNVLVTEDGSLALIDIADIRFRRSGALTTAQRKRNFKHLTRYPIDCELLSQGAERTFIQAYFAAADLPQKAQLSLEKALIERLAHTKQ